MNSTTSNPSVAVLGLGIMGRGMASNLLKAGFPLTVFNRSPERTAPFAADGARVAMLPSDASDGNNVIISMVADDEASRSVWLGESGALSNAAPGTVLIESSTLSVGWVKELAAVAAERGCTLIDAPVTGSKVHAASGELRFLAGGSAESIETARAVLEAMSAEIVHVGPSGSGALLKLVNNFMCGVQAASLAEAIALVERGGLDPVKALGLLANGAPSSPMVKGLLPRMVDGEYTDPNFVLRLMTKDLSYACKEGEQRSLSMTTASAARSVFEKAVAEGHGEKDLSAVVEQFR